MRQHLGLWAGARGLICGLPGVGVIALVHDYAARGPSPGVAQLGLELAAALPCREAVAGGHALGG